jgi:glucokinase
VANVDPRWALGIDLGGTNLRLCALRQGADGRVEQTAPRAVRWRDESGESGVSFLLEQLKNAQAEAWAAWFGAEAGAHSVHRAGFAVAAQLSPDGRSVANAPNLGWRDVPLADLAAAALGLAPADVMLVNDLKAIVAGEIAAGALLGVSSAFAMYVGTGVGGAFAARGRVWTGAGGNAGEIGHVKLPTIQARCGCGQVGCVEAVAGGGALEKRIAAANQTAQNGAPIRSVADVDAAAEAGDPWACALWSEVSEALSFALSSAITLFNPEVVLLGGGVLERAPHLRTQVETRSQELTLAVAAANVRFQHGQLGDFAGCSGAGATALHYRLDEW